MWNMHFCIYWGILMVLNIGIIVWYYAQTLEPRIAPFKIFLIYYFCNMGNTLLCAEILGIYKLKTILYFLYNVAVLVFLFRGKVDRKLVSGFWIFIAQMLTEVSGFCALRIMGLDISVIEHYTAIKNILVGVDIPLQGLLCIGFLKVQKGFGFQLDWKKMWLVIKCYCGEMVIVFMVPIMHWYFNAVMSAVLLLSKFALVLIMMYLVILMKTMETKQLTENKTKYLQQQSRMVLQYCNAINEKTANLEELRAEYEKKLNEVYAVVAKNRNDNGIDSFQKEKRSGA